MSKDIVFHQRGRLTNPDCILPSGGTRTYLSLGVDSDVFIKDIKRPNKYLTGVIVAQRNRYSRWFYKVQTMKFVKWCRPEDFKIKE